MRKVFIYTASLCPYCHMAKELLRSKGVNYDEVDVTNAGHLRAEMRAAKRVAGDFCSRAACPNNSAKITAAVLASPASIKLLRAETRNPVLSMSRTCASA